MAKKDFCLNPLDYRRWRRANYHGIYALHRSGLSAAVLVACLRDRRKLWRKVRDSLAAKDASQCQKG